MHYYQWVKCPQIWSWKDCTSQNYKILLNFRLYWLCMIKRLLGIRKAGLFTVQDKSEISCRFKFCKYPFCKFWHPPVCLNYKSDKGCVHGDKCHFRHVEAEGKLNKKSKKSGAKDQLRYEGVYTIGFFFSRFLSEKFYSTWNKDKNTPSNFPKVLGTKLKFGKERVHREVLSKSVRLMNVIFAHRNSRRYHMWRSYTK